MNMRNIDRIFILTGAFFAVAGMCTGLWMVAVNSFVYSKIHAHINLLGWVSLAIYGVVYRIYPAMKDSSLALTHLVCSVAGVIFMNLGWWMFLQNILVGSYSAAVRRSASWGSFCSWSSSGCTGKTGRKPAE